MNRLVQFLYCKFPCVFLGMRTGISNWKNIMIYNLCLFCFYYSIEIFSFLQPWILQRVSQFNMFIFNKFYHLPNVFISQSLHTQKLFEPNFGVMKSLEACHINSAQYRCPVFLVIPTKVLPPILFCAPIIGAVALMSSLKFMKEDINWPWWRKIDDCQKIASPINEHLHFGPSSYPLYDERSIHSTQF